MELGAVKDLRLSVALLVSLTVLGGCRGGPAGDEGEGEVAALAEALRFESSVVEIVGDSGAVEVRTSLRGPGGSGESVPDGFDASVASICKKVRRLSLAESTEVLVYYQTGELAKEC